MMCQIFFEGVEANPFYGRTDLTVAISFCEDMLGMGNQFLSECHALGPVIYNIPELLFPHATVPTFVALIHTLNELVLGMDFMMSITSLSSIRCCVCFSRYLEENPFKTIMQ